MAIDANEEVIGLINDLKVKISPRHCDDIRAMQLATRKNVEPYDSVMERAIFEFCISAYSYRELLTDDTFLGSQSNIILEKQLKLLDNAIMAFEF